MLVPESKILDKLPISLDVCFLQMIEKTSALPYHLEQTATAMMILRMSLEVIGQIIDALSQNRDLHFAGAGVSTVRTVLVNCR